MPRYHTTIKALLDDGTLCFRPHFADLLDLDSSFDVEMEAAVLNILRLAGPKRLYFQTLYNFLYAEGYLTSQMKEDATKTPRRGRPHVPEKYFNSKGGAALPRYGRPVLLPVAPVEEESDQPSLDKVRDNLAKLKASMKGEPRVVFPGAAEVKRPVDTRKDKFREMRRALLAGRGFAVPLPPEEV